jgi:hypothetical protein
MVQQSSDYIATDASVKKVADALGVTFVNKTGAALLSGGSSDLYVFTNGIKGTGPMGFQASIASTNVGDTAYSPLWRIQATTWKDPSHAEFLTSVTQITSAAQAGKLANNIAGVVVNCPIVNVHVKCKQRKGTRQKRETIPFLFLQFYWE